MPARANNLTQFGVKLDTQPRQDGSPPLLR
jgi:hypothetical protein